MKVLFVIPKNKSLFGTKGKTVHPHVGVAYLTSFLKENHIEVKIFDDGLELNKGMLETAIKEVNPDLIAVTIFSYCSNLAYELIYKINKITDKPIVVGGTHISAINKEIFNKVKIEFAIKQEGEYALLELIKNLSKPDLSHIANLIWKDQEGNIIENTGRDLIADLDSLPFPNYDAFGIENYICYKQKSIPLITSRGCPFSCNYCSVKLSMGQRFRARSAENVFQEINQLYEQGFNNFEINDDCFTLDRERVIKICDYIIENGLNIKFQLYNGIRVDTVDLELLKKLKQAGCYFIAYGCEAGTERILKIIRKGITLQQVKNAVNWTNEAGIPNAVNFIIGHKEETYQDALNTLSFAESLPTNFVNFYNLLPYPNTESYDWIKENARFLVPMDYINNISYRDNEPIYETFDFTKEQRKKILKLGFDLYRQRILTFRLGKRLGNIIYHITKNNWLNEILSDFALNNMLGRFIYTNFSKRLILAEEK